jgi:Reverse transcriptase (RNA-dependent DNA polymerase)
MTAFDRVEYCKLFNLLMEWQILTCILRILINFYTNRHVRVAWSGVMSDYFLAANGVKQGGVLSLVLFLYVY